jgi:hypothetical protein
MVQWQAYLRNATTGDYTRRLGFFAAGHDATPPLNNTSFEACKAACDERQCFGFCFESDDPKPDHIGLCYVKNTTHLQPADLSSSGHCSGNVTPSDCPYNIYRTSGDIGTCECLASVCVSLICLLDWVSVCTFRSARLNSLTLAFLLLCRLGPNALESRVHRALPWRPREGEGEARPVKTRRLGLP